jgi:hypothetical protein
MTQVGPVYPKTVYPILGFLPGTKDSFEAGKKELLDALKPIETYLKSNSYLGGK